MSNIRYIIDNALLQGGGKVWGQTAANNNDDVDDDYDDGAGDLQPAPPGGRIKHDLGDNGRQGFLGGEPANGDG